MNTHRCIAWEQLYGAVFLTTEARYTVGATPAIVTLYTLVGDDDRAAKVDIFQFLDARLPVAIIDPAAPEWAEGAIAQMFKADGNKRN